MTGADVAELARRGLIPVADCYKGWPLCDGRALEAFTDGGTADESAVYLLIRRSDFGHLVRAGLLAPADWGHGPWDRRDEFSVPLYRTGDLDDLVRRTDIDWDAFRGTHPRSSGVSAGEPYLVVTLPYFRKLQACRSWHGLWSCGIGLPRKQGRTGY